MKLFRHNLFACLLGLVCFSVPAWGYNSEWELVFNDEFSSSSFDDDGTLTWDTEGGQWNKIAYTDFTPAWRKYQSRDDSLVVSGQENGTDYVTLKGTYGDYTSVNDHNGTNDTFACGGIFTDQTFSFQYGYVEVRAL